MKIHRIAVLALALMALGAVPAEARTFSTGTALRSALPRPGKNALAGTTEYVGTDASGRISIALVRARGGGAVAYLCDGRRISSWLTGTATSSHATLSGGSTLKATISGATARGTARLGTRTLRFTLRRAEPGSGLRRYTDPFSGATLEAAWIVTRDGRIRGAGKARRRIVLTTDTTVLGPAAEEVTDRQRSAASAVAPVAQTARFTLILKARCAVTVLKISSLERQELEGTITADGEAALADARKAFDSLGCGDAGGFQEP